MSNVTDLILVADAEDTGELIGYIDNTPVVFFPDEDDEVFGYFFKVYEKQWYHAPHSGYTYYVDGGQWRAAWEGYRFMDENDKLDTNSGNQYLLYKD